MVKEDLSAGGGAPYFLTSLLDHAGCNEEHLELCTIKGWAVPPCREQSWSGGQKSV